jgi:pantoate--beta-alanine ligase
VNVAEDIVGVRQAIAAARRRGETVRFVPTMGALHAGHRSLIDAARSDGGCVVVSIFVNPTQFGPQEDLQKYPRPRDADLALCRDAGADVVFYPPVHEMYRPDAATFVQVDGLSAIWEGAARPTHFRGVTTVVAKLFHIVMPDVAYFGQKDFQQQVVIRRMVRDLDFPVLIRTCPTVRDADGLALSSRNAYLSPSERSAALCLSRALRLGRGAWEQGQCEPRTLAELLRREIGQTAGVELDYAVVVDPESLAELDRPQPNMVALLAAKVGSTRLIDNDLWFSETGNNGVRTSPAT